MDGDEGRVMRAQPPAGHVRVRRLLDRYRLGPAGRRRLLTHPEWTPGTPQALTDYPDATALWTAIRKSEFPPPTAGPWGHSWPLAAVLAWRKSRGLPPLKRTRTHAR